MTRKQKEEITIEISFTLLLVLSFALGVYVAPQLDRKPVVAVQVLK